MHFCGFCTHILVLFFAYNLIDWIYSKALSIAFCIDFIYTFLRHNSLVLFPSIPCKIRLCGLSCYISLIKYKKIFFLLYIAWTGNNRQSRRRPPPWLLCFGGCGLIALVAWLSCQGSKATAKAKPKQPSRNRPPPKP